MNRLISYQFESYTGAFLVVILAGFFVGLLFIAIENFNTDVELLTTDQARLRTVSITERRLIDSWITENNIAIPEGKGYRYLIESYPSKPWLR
jgi:hypothetical protein